MRTIDLKDTATLKKLGIKKIDLKITRVNEKWEAVNSEAIQIAINAAEGRATSRTITEVEIECAVADAEKLISQAKIANYRPKMFIQTSAGYSRNNFCNAYQHVPEQTYAPIEWVSGCWRLVSVGRYGIFDGSNGEMVGMPLAAKIKLANNLLAAVNVFGFENQILLNDQKKIAEDPARGDENE